MLENTPMRKLFNMRLLEEKGAQPEAKGGVGRGNLSQDATGPGLALVQVRDFWLSTSPMTSEFIIFVWTFGGELSIAAAWNEAYYATQTAETLLQGTKVLLGNGFGIGMTATTGGYSS